VNDLYRVAVEHYYQSRDCCSTSS